MPVYSSQSLKDKMKNKFDIRKLELPFDVWKKIIIPDDAQLYHRLHFKVKTMTPFRNSKYDIIDCFNQEPGQDGEGCPICDFIKELWADWRIANKAKDATAKKKLQDNINAIMSEEYWLNCINIEDPDFLFQAVRLTSSNFAEYEKMRDSHGVGNFIIRYQKKKGPPVRYSLIDDDLNAVATDIIKNMEALKNRHYDMGGPCDLDRIARNYKDIASYKEILEGGDGPDEEPGDPKAETKQEKIPQINVEEQETSLEEMGLDLEAKPPAQTATTPAKVETKPVTPAPVADNSLDAGLSLDPINLDGDISLDSPLEIPLEEEKFFTVTAVEFKDKWGKENVKCEAWIKTIYNTLFAEKKIAQCPGLKEMVPAIFNFLKTQTAPVKIKE